MAVVQCPSGSTGFAKWPCDSTGTTQLDRRAEWNIKGPSLAECRSLWLGELDSKLRGGLVSVGNVSNILAEKTSTQHTESSNILYGGDLVLGARMLKHMAERMHYDLQRTVNLEAREAMVTDLVQNVVKTASNLISDSNHRRQSWGDLSPDEHGRAATALLVGLEENAFLLAETVTSEKIIIKPTENICKLYKQ
jgi:latrophilin 1